ncbi:hypothetical protein Tco_1095629 [Tanacetum coccineum]
MSELIRYGLTPSRNVVTPSLDELHDNQYNRRIDVTVDSVDIGAINKECIRMGMFYLCGKLGMESEFFSCHGKTSSILSAANEIKKMQQRISYVVVITHMYLKTEKCERMRRCYSIYAKLRICLKLTWFVVVRMSYGDEAVKMPNGFEVKARGEQGAVVVVERTWARFMGYNIIMSSRSLADSLLLLIYDSATLNTVDGQYAKDWTLRCVV